MTETLFKVVVDTEPVGEDGWFHVSCDAIGVAHILCSGKEVDPNDAIPYTGQPQCPPCWEWENNPVVCPHCVIIT